MLLNSISGLNKIFNLLVHHDTPVLTNSQKSTGLMVDMKTRMLSIISIGITIGFLLGLGVVAVLRSIIQGESPELEVAFTSMVAMMVGGLASYVVKTYR